MGKSADAATTFNLCDYLEEILLTLKPQLEKRPIQIILSCPNDLQITSYKNAWSHIITNLVQME